MDIKLNIPDWLKIPLNILLPALWLFSGAVLLCPDAYLSKFYLLEWRNEHGFAFGLTFIISSCLLAVYALSYLFKRILAVGHKLTFKRNTIKKISKMNDTEHAIILKMYTSPGYTCQLDYNQPLTQGLLARNYIYMGSQQQVTLDVFTNSIPALFTLQPFVYQTLDHYKEKIEKEIARLEAKEIKSKDSKKAKIAEKLCSLREMHNTLCNGF